MKATIFTFLFLGMIHISALPVSASTPIPHLNQTFKPIETAQPQRENTTAQHPPKKTLMQFLTTTVLPGALGSAGVVGGAIFAWWALRNKNKAFESYLSQIKTEQNNFLLALQKQQDKNATIQMYRQALTRIQEDAETATAVKKLNAEHLTAIMNKIQRNLEEVKLSEK